MDALAERGAICLDCRTALAPGETCDRGARHRVVNLRSGDGREALLSEVWGPPSVRRRIKQIAAAGGAGAAGGSMLGPAAEIGCEVMVMDGALGLIIMAVAAVIMLFYAAITRVTHMVRMSGKHPRPNGARVQPRRLRGRHTGGRVAEVKGLVTAPSGQQVAAYGLRLMRKQSNLSALMLSDGHCAGFTVEAEDGTRILVPAGRVRLEGPDRLAQAVAEPRVASYLQQFDGDYLADPEELAMVPHDRAEEFTIKRGDGVEVLSRLQPMPDPRAAAGGYRDAAGTVQVAQGIPQLRVSGA